MFKDFNSYGSTYVRFGYDDPNPNDPPPPPPPPPPPGDDESKKFSQKDMNALEKKIKEQHRRNMEQITQRLNALEQSSTMTQEEKEKLANQLEQMRQEYMTKEELAKQNEDKVKKDYEGKIKKYESERDSWRDRFTQATIQRSLTDAAVTSEAYNPSQIVGLLAPITRLVEEVDSQGKPTGNFVPKVKWETVKDGQNISLEVVPSEALKLMKDKPEQYGNLFKSSANGGLGSNNNSQGGSNNTRMPPKDTDAYLKWRKEHNLPS